MSSVSAELEELLRGLRSDPPVISPKYFYDQRGSALFEKICEQQEYYLTRTEISILESCASDVMDLLCPGGRAASRPLTLLEPGSGASVKTRLLLEKLPPGSVYVPMDISGSFLKSEAGKVEREFENMTVIPTEGDFTRVEDLATAGRLMPVGMRRLIFFPGSTLGNFAPAAATALLSSLGELADGDGALLLGVDLVKDPRRLEAAYNDCAGVTAEFNRNVLARINRQFGATFDVDAFDHLAFFNAEASRIEMHLLCARGTRATLAGVALEFKEGDRIHTENSYKFTPTRLERLAAESGWRVRQAYFDSRRDFGVFLLFR